MSLDGSYVEAWLSKMRMRREGEAASLGDADRMRRKEGKSELKARLLLVVMIVTAVAYVALTSKPGYQDGLEAFQQGDYVKALEIWEPQAARGESRAQVAIGNMYFNGRGVPKDDMAAVYWYRQAAENGRIGGPIKLAEMYERGLGVDQDTVTALMWVRIARSFSTDVKHGKSWEISQALKSLESVVSAEEIEESKHLAQQWLSENR